VLSILKRTVPFSEEVIMATEETEKEQKANQEADTQGYGVLKEINASPEKEQRAGQEAGTPSGPSSANVVEFLRKSNILNMEVPLKTLFEQLETLQPDPSSGWGVVGDSGHLFLVWVGK
jgi:hypothetical protein